MKMKRLLMLLTLLLLAHAAALASVFGAVKVIVHDPQHRPISGARIVLKSVTSDWKSDGATREAGQFQLQTVPIGDYRLTVSAPGFSDQAISVTVTAGNASDVHLQLAIAKVQETVNVTAESPDVNPSSSTTETMISRRQISETPGADQTNSLAAITSYVPGAYVVHDQLHIRGGHQVTWAIDGVPVPDRKSTRLNSSHTIISYAVFCLKKKK